jgi:preprotein translocase subunit SecF
MSFSFVRTAKWLLPLSVLAMIASIVVFVSPGPQVSIEFTGGTLMEVQLPEGKTRDDLSSALASFTGSGTNLSAANLSQTQKGSWFIRIPTLNNEQHTALLAHMNQTIGQVQELQYTTIGPTVGASLKHRSFWALFAACVAIVIYVAAAFRKIPKSLSPWMFGLCAIAALVHDIVITVGIFTVLSHTTTFQMDTLFVTALLSIMGYSVSDTIVIFDRVRDNLIEQGKRADNLTKLADDSLWQSFSRTLNTGLCALIMLFALLIFGSESIRWFMLALIVGTLIGTYSSFFVATPLLVFWKKWSSR